MKSKILLISLVAVLALSIGLVGCTGDGGDEHSLTSINIAYPGGPGFGAALSSMDPCSFGYGGPPHPNIYEPLVGQDADEELFGLLAQNWSWDGTGTILTVNLRQGVKFSSGDDFDADDVLFTLQRCLDVMNMPIVDQLSPPQGYNYTEKTGTHQVKFHFTKINTQFVAQTLVNMPIASKDYYDSVGEAAYLACPVGTGPYKIDTWAEGDYCDVVYNDLYRGTAPQIEDAHFVVYGTPTTGVAMLQAEEVALLSQAPGASIAFLEGAGYNKINVTLPHALAIQFNMLNATAPWAIPGDTGLWVRQAINYAIDKEALAASLVCGPMQEGAWALSSAPWYNSSLDPSYAYNFTKAMQLLHDAGYGDLGHIHIDIAYLSTETVAPLADYVASSLMATIPTGPPPAPELSLNISVTLIPYAGMPQFMPALTTIHNQYPNAPDTPGAFVYDTGWPGNPAAAIDLTNGFYWGKDNTLFYDTTITDKVDDVLTTLDDTTRWGYADEAWQMIDALLPQIPIGIEVQSNFCESYISYTKSVGGMNAGPTQLVDLTIAP